LARGLYFGKYNPPSPGEYQLMSFGGKNKKIGKRKRGKCKRERKKGKRKTDKGKENEKKEVEG
jgi:hypothetical protein